MQFKKIKVIACTCRYLQNNSVVMPYFSVPAGNYRDGAGVVLSLRDRDHMGLPLNRSAVFTFDNLRLPYHLPVTLCNESGQHTL